MNYIQPSEKEVVLAKEIVSKKEILAQDYYIKAVVLRDRVLHVANEASVLKGTRKRHQRVQLNAEEFYAG